ncbi:transcriptional regulator FtsR [Varibaculum vaginae]|uniref:transcriptional regulator FtsR n=1 Tax=Varibaculum vaginae TaxID=2364797 RepID=UPI0013572DEA|nr:MerR family transcriptional regulator [Varibaculum vaginae]
MQTGAAQRRSVPAASPIAWPPGVSDKAVFSIGKVVERIKSEFPTISVSKLRFLEEQGIVSPARTASGYRKYSAADIERVRYCLTRQRDSFMPLRVIRENLAQLDAGRSLEEVQTEPKAARLVASEGQLVASSAPDGTLTTRELLDLSGISTEELDTFVQAGLVSPDLSGRFSARSHQIVKLASILVEQGIPPRQLRFLKTSALRLLDLVERAASPVNYRATPVAKARHLSETRELSEAAAQMFLQMVRVSAEKLN